MVVLTNHMLTGVYVCLCVRPGFGATQLSCVLGLIILACVLQQLCTKSQERERESQTWRISFP